MGCVRARPYDPHMPYNTFNVADWKLRETPAGLVLRPTLWHALAFRLFFGTGAMAIFLLGAGGLDYELSKMEQARRVIAVIRSLTEHFAEHPRSADLVPGSEPAIAEAVRYVSGMTDRFALDLAVGKLGWDTAALPQGV